MVVGLRLIRRRRPAGRGVDIEFSWVCSCLGFCQPKDRDRTAQAILGLLLEKSRHGGGLRSDDIAESVGKSRGATVNHLNKLMNAGLVTKRGNFYELREASLEDTIRELQRDMERMFEDLLTAAHEIDGNF